MCDTVETGMSFQRPLLDDEAGTSRRFPSVATCLTAAILASNLSILGLFSYFVYRTGSLFDDVERDGARIAEGVKNVSRIFEGICRGLEPMGWCDPAEFY